MNEITARIQELKKEYGQSAEQIIANGLGLIKTGKKYKCPNSFVHRNNDRDPSMSWNPTALEFKCFGCNHRIDIYSYYKDHLNYTNQEILGDLKDIESSRNSFYSETKKVGELTKDCMEYIKLRGLTESTAKAFKLGTYNNQIAFPYYKFDTIVGYKLRQPIAKPTGAKMTNIKGSKPYLFGSQNVIPGEELIICEGEFDAMVIYQCGYRNVVSIGAGANSIKTIFEQAREFLSNFKNIIIVSDNDEAGNKMDRDATDILSKFKCNGRPVKARLIDKKIYALNDINDEYYKFGEEKIKKIIDSARFKIEGRRDLEITPYLGIADGCGKYVPTGIETIDQALNDLEPRRLTLVTGRSNGGKTTFIKQVIANAIDKQNKVYLMNGENDADMLINDLYKTVIGRDDKYYYTIKINKRYFKEPKIDTLVALRAWHKNKLFMFNKGESKLKTLEELMKMLEIEIKYNQYDLVVIDNLMSILSVNAAEKYEQQADFTQMLCDLSKNYNTHIILVLHPNKTYQKGEDMDMEQISGSSDIYNKADNIIAVTREYDEEKVSNGINGYIQVIKNRYYGELVKIETNFDKETGLLLERRYNEWEEQIEARGYTFKFQDYLDEAKGVLKGEQMAIDGNTKRQ